MLSRMMSGIFGLLTLLTGVLLGSDASLLLRDPVMAALGLFGGLLGALFFASWAIQPEVRRCRHCFPCGGEVPGREVARCSRCCLRTL